MADVSITPANVVLSSGSAKTGTAGGTITAGMSLYQDAADSDHLKGCDTSGAAALASCVGIALNSASDGQPLSYAPTGSTLNIGGTVVLGTIYCCSETAGGIQPSTDVGSGEFVTVLGVATTAALLQLKINVSGVEVA